MSLLITQRDSNTTHQAQKKETKRKSKEFVLSKKCNHNNSWRLYNQTTHGVGAPYPEGGRLGEPSQNKSVEKKKRRRIACLNQKKSSSDLQPRDKEDGAPHREEVSFFPCQRRRWTRSWNI
jgi:hypothetical protein